MPSSASSPTLPPDVRELVRVFNDREVRYLVVGAHALACWAQPRATGDLDLWVEPTAENAGRILAALADFGVAPSDLTATDLFTPGTVFQMGEPPWRIDLDTELTGLRFAEAWPGHAEVEIEGLPIRSSGARP